jgi:hypothetical protein
MMSRPVTPSAAQADECGTWGGLNRDECARIRDAYLAHHPETQTPDKGAA